MHRRVLYEGPEAQQLLSQLCTAVADGVREFGVQQTPFYEARLRPLLTHWALLWLRRNRVQHGSDKQIVGYISRDPDADGLATVLADGTIGARPDGHAAVGLSAWVELVGAMPDEHAQLINLTHTWLRSVLPHVICRVGHIHYGLLSDAGTAAAAPAASYLASGGAASCSCSTRTWSPGRRRASATRRRSRC